MDDAARSIRDSPGTPPGRAPPPLGAAPPAGPAPPSKPPAVSWAASINLIALVLLLWLAIGAACEILTRNEDYARVAGYQKWLLACRTTSPPDKNNPPDKSCPADGLDGWVEVVSIQVRRYNSLNSIGARDRCNVAAVFASPIGDFYEDCLTLLSSDNKGIDNKLKKPENKVLLQEILSPGWLSYSGFLLQFDQASKEHLYFFLVLASAVIGSPIAGLRIDGFTCLRDLALGLGAGFAVYILLRGGNFVFFTGPATIDILNPFTAATVGLLVGLFKDRAFGLIDGVVATSQPSTATQTAAKAQAAAASAAQAKATALQTAAKTQENAVDAAEKAHAAVAEAATKAKEGAADASDALAKAVDITIESQKAAAEAANAQAAAAKL